MLAFKILVNGLDSGKQNILKKSADIAGVLFWRDERRTGIQSALIIIELKLQMAFL